MTKPKAKYKKVILVILIAIAILLSPLAAMFVAFTGIWIGPYIHTFLFEPIPSKPEITYGEFPFEIVYEIDGEMITINDVYVCEYEGIRIGYLEKYRSWKGYFKSTGDDLLVLLQDGNLKFCCHVGDPNYYMSDPTMQEQKYVPYIFYEIFPNEMGGKSSGILDIEPMLEEYKLKLVSWNLSEPIKNSYKNNWIFSVTNNLNNIFFN